MPSLWAVTSFSIFIASTIATSVPSLTLAPAVTAIFSTVPCIGLRSSSPLAALAAPFSRRAALRARAGRRRAPAPRRRGR